jgi:hypothetical protein
MESEKNIRSQKAVVSSQKPKVTSRRHVFVGLLVFIVQACPLLGLDATDYLWLDNPVLTSQQQIDQKLMACEDLLAALAQQEQRETLPARLQRLKVLARLYMVFAGSEGKEAGVESGRLELLDLSQTADPAVSQLRDQMKIPCPSGFVFLRYYSSRHVMPLEILSAFHRENTRGVTILSRYIAILEKKASEPGQERFLEQSQARIVSHELVHAYINSVLGRDRDRLPLWFHEACATYLSGSPGGERVSELVQTPAGFKHVLFQDKAPIDYQQYKLLFEYLRAKLGRKDLYAQIRTAIHTRSVQSLLSCAQVNSSQELVTRAQVWKQRRNLLKYGVAAVLVIGLLLVIWRMLPQRPKHVEPEV